MLFIVKNNYSGYEEKVNEILTAVKTEGDKALFDYTLKYDKYQLTPENIRVTAEEIREAYAFNRSFSTFSRVLSVNSTILMWFSFYMVKC